MKKIRVIAKVYDTTTCEWVQTIVTKTISDELAEMLQKEFRESDGTSYETKGHGRGEDRGKIPGLRTPLCSQKRFWIEPMFHVVDEDDKEYCGWRGL